jgi:hypothetical protein
VAGGASDLGDEGLHRLFRQRDGIAGRQIVRDDDRVFAHIVDEDHARSKRIKQAIADEVDVAAALAEIGVAEGIEARTNLVHGGADGPLGTFAVVDDVAARAFDQHRVGEHQQMRLEDRAVLASFLAQGHQRVARVRPRFFGAAHLVGNAGGLDAVLRVLPLTAVDEVNATAGDSGGNTDARQNLFRRRGRERRHRRHCRR